MPRKPHPADVADRAAISDAVEFTAFLRLGPRKKIVERFPLMAAAAERAEALRTEHKGRDVLVYAVLATGNTIPVPKDMQGAAVAEAEEAGRRAPAAIAGRRLTGRYLEMGTAAARGVVPPAPDFSAKTHTAYRGKLAALVALVEAKDVDGLRANTWKPYDSSMVALVRYRDMAIVALEAWRMQRAA